MDLREFEDCCLRGRTAELTHMRDSGSSGHTLELMASSSQPVAQFLALSIAQHQLMASPQFIPDTLVKLLAVARNPAMLRIAPSSVVLTKLLQVIASLVKRNLSILGSEQVLSIIAGFESEPLVCIEFIAALVGEFNCRGRIGIYGTTLQFHRDSHADFEASLLKPCFERGLQALQYCLALAQASDPAAAASIFHSLSLLEELLQWEFGAVTLSAHEMRAPDSLPLPVEWKAIADAAIVNSCFWLLGITHQRTTEAPNASDWARAHSAARDVVLDLCCINGRVFTTLRGRRGFADAIAANLIPLLTSAGQNVDAQETALPLLCSAIHRLANTFKITILDAVVHFSRLVKALHGLTLGLARSLRMDADRVVQLIRAGRSEESDLLEDWRWQTIEQLLDTWAAMLMDPAVPLTHAEKILKAHAAHMFNDMIGSLIATVLADSVSAAGAEEGAEAERAAALRVEGMVSAVCLLGRSAIFAAMNTTISVLDNELTKVLASAGQPQPNSIEDVISLETLRMCVLILTKLVSDAEDGSEDVAQFGDAAVMPQAMLAAVKDAPTEIPAPLVASFTSVTRLLDAQLSLMCTSRTHPLYSQSVVIVCLRYLQLHILAYFKPDTKLYSRLTIEQLPCFFKSNCEYILSSCSFLSDSVNKLLQIEGLNAELVAPATALYVVASYKDVLRTAILQTPQAQLLIESVASGNFHASLSMESFACLFHSLGVISLQLDDGYTETSRDDKFEQLCRGIADEMSRLSTSSSDELSLLLWVGKLTGISKCAADRNGVFAGLLVYTLPLLCQIVEIVHSDPVLRAALNLVIIIVERHLFAFRPAVCISLYRTARVLIDIATKSLSKTSSANVAIRNEEAVFRSEYWSDVLHLLGDLGVKEFMLDEADEDIDIAAIIAFEEEVVETMFFGLVKVVPLMTRESLSAFPVNIERYVSFLSFLVGSYEKEVLRFLQSDNTTAVLLFDHMLFCSMNSESIMGQMALRCIESLADITWKSRGEIDPVVLAKLESCEECMSLWFLDAFLVSDGRRVVVLDRFDAFAAALLALIRLGPPKFREILEKAVVTLPINFASIAPHVSSFLASVNIDLTTQDSSTRRLFMQLLKRFSEDLQSQSSFVNSDLVS